MSPLHPSNKSIQKNIDYKRKKEDRKKQKREKRGKEEPYPKETSLTYHSIPPFSTHFNIPYASELRKSMKVRGEVATGHPVGNLVVAYPTMKTTQLQPSLEQGIQG